MARAGSGGGGSRSSGGGHSRSRSGGGHRVGGGSRAGSSRSYHSSSSYRGSNHHSHGSYHYHGPSHHRVGYRPAYHVPPRRVSLFSEIVSTIAVAIIVIVALYMTFRGSGNTKSTIQRYKIENVAAYDNDNIIDEIGWFDNISSTSRRLKDFWDETGVQPYIYLKAYDSSLKSDSQKEAFAKQYYDENINTENGFLFVYFAEKNTDGEVGYMYYVNGYQTSSVMDSEAVEIFWNYIDRYWYTDMSTDDLFISVFNKTGTTIMKVSKSMADVLVVLTVGIVIIAVVYILFRWWQSKRKAEKERAAETEAILNTPIDTLGSSGNDLSDLTSKYD